MTMHQISTLHVLIFYKNTENVPCNKFSTASQKRQQTNHHQVSDALRSPQHSVVNTSNNPYYFITLVLILIELNEERISEVLHV